MRGLAVGALGLIAGALGACGDSAPTYRVSGNAFDFTGSPEVRIAGATVTLVEDPTRTTVTAADGSFAFDGFAEGDEATFDLVYPNFHPIRTGTLLIEQADVERLTFQVVPEAIYTVLANSLAITPDPAKCQIVTTVTRVGKSLYDPGAHGEAGATVAIAPAGAEEGPVYFNASVQPERGLTETSEDGGVLYVNVAPGEYWLTATKPGATFRTFKMKCAAGLLVNAAPPWGLQRLP